MSRLLLAALICLAPLAAWAGEAKDLAKDPVVEKRLIGLASNLRCLVCQNESLAASQADLAKDLRREVREQIQAGKTDKQIIDYLVARYGDFVLYDPPVKSYTIPLWFGPFILMLIGAGVLFYQLRKRKVQVSEVELSGDAHRRAEALLKKDDQA